MAAVLVKEAVMFDLSKIIIDKRYQTRDAEDPQAIRDIGEKVLEKEDDNMEPVVIFMLPDGPTLVAGFHRYAGYNLAGKRKIRANVYEGDEADAIEAAGRSNRDHKAVRMTNADQRKAAFLLCGNKALREKYDAAGLADIIGVSVNFMKKMIKIYDNPLPVEKKPPVPTITKARTHQTNILDYAPPTTAQDGSPLESNKVTPPTLTLPTIVPTPEAPLYDDLVLGDRWMLGDNVIYIDEISTLKKKLETYDHVLYFGDLETLRKNQKMIDDLSPALTVGITSGLEYPNLLTVGWQIEQVSLATVRGVPHFLAHYGTVKDPKDLSVSEWGLFAAELSDHGTPQDKGSVLVINPMGLSIPQIYKRGRTVSVITTNLDLARSELLTWAKTYDPGIKV
jgi:ParB-like nuclease domain